MALLAAILRRSATKTASPFAAGRLLIGGGAAARYHHHHHNITAATAASAVAVERTNFSSDQFCSFFGRQSCVRRGFSTDHRPSSDKALLEIIESEIECAKETEEPAQLEELPPEFPFKIEDNLRKETITLTREYDGEIITVEVSMPDLVTGEHEDNDADDEEPAQSSIPLLVSVAKKDGSSLEFSCTAFSDEITIDSLSLKSPDVHDDGIAYEGPDFSDLDENLQKGFRKYLEIRGIKPSVTNFLYEYMIQKDSREYLQWLQDVKNFVTA